MNNFKTRSISPFVEMVGHWLEGGVRMLPGHNTCGGAVMLRPIKLWCAAVWFSAEVRSIYMYTFSYKYVLVF